MAEDRPLQPLRLRPGVDAELIGQHRAKAPVGPQRLGLPPVAVQRKHELGPAPLPQRLRGHQRLAGRDRLVVPTERQHRRHPVLGRGLAHLVEPGGLGARERPVCELGDGRPAPQGQRLVEPDDRGCVIAAVGRPPRLNDQRLGLRDVGRRPVEDIAGWTRHDRGAGATLHAATQPQHVVLQRLRRSARRRPLPKRIHEVVLGDDLPGVNRQDDEQTALHRPAQPHPAPRPDHLDRAENPHGSGHPTSFTRSVPGVQTRMERARVASSRALRTHRARCNARDECTTRAESTRRRGGRGPRAFPGHRARARLPDPADHRRPRGANRGGPPVLLGHRRHRGVPPGRRGRRGGRLSRRCPGPDAAYPGGGRARAAEWTIVTIARDGVLVEIVAEEAL